MNTTLFYDDIKKGNIGEEIFKKDFLQFLDIKYEDVTGRQAFQAIDSDYLSKIGLYEIKTNYKDNDIIIIEDYTNANEKLAPLSYGWFYKSKADMLVFISKSTRAMIMIPFTDNFKRHYELIKNDYELAFNKVSEKDGNYWQSAYRKIPLLSISGYYSHYIKK
jgi:hypothetical protein